jgi:hypothetical protein
LGRVRGIGRIVTPIRKDIKRKETKGERQRQRKEKKKERKEKKKPDRTPRDKACKRRIRIRSLELEWEDWSTRGRGYEPGVRGSPEGPCTRGRSAFAAAAAASATSMLT